MDQLPASALLITVLICFPFFNQVPRIPRMRLL